MSQSFRSPPRQIGFSSQGRRLSPTEPGRAGLAGKAEDPRIRQHAVQLQQLGSRLRQLQERLAKTQVPLARQQVEKQIQALQQQLKQHQRALMELRGQARIERLKPLRAALTGEIPDLAELFRHHLAELEAIYRVHQPLPKGLMPRLEAWLQPLRKLQTQWQGLDAPSLAAFLSESETLLADLSARFWPQEGEVLSAFWQAWQKHLRAHWSDEGMDTSSAGAELDAVQTVSFAPPAQAETESTETFADEGELQISFDFSAGKSVVRNQMGITLNQPKKSYEVYLEEGFQAIDQTVASHFENLQPLYQAVEQFLEAISQDKSRYEAYFGLGYLYSLVRDLNHALYFLDIAWKISGDQAIWEMMDKVRNNADLRDGVSV